MATVKRVEAERHDNVDESYDDWTHFTVEAEVDGLGAYYIVPKDEVEVATRHGQTFVVRPYETESLWPPFGVFPLPQEDA